MKHQSSIRIDAEEYPKLLAAFNLARQEGRDQFVFEQDGQRLPFDRGYCRYFLEYHFGKVWPDQARRDFNVDEITLIAEGKLAEAKAAWHARTGK